MLTANVLDGDGLPPGTTINYQWQQSADDGNKWSDIGGETTAILALQQDQVGKRVRLVAAYVDALGNSESVTSNITAPVGNANDVGLASFTGTPVQGQTLTASVVDLDGLNNVAVTYRWQQLVGSTWSNISGATGPSWTLQAAQVGRQVRLRVTYTDQASGTETNRTSPATPPIVASNPAGDDTGLVSLIETPTQYQTLAASVTDLDGIPTGAVIAYQWQQRSDIDGAWSNIAGANASTLTLQQAISFYNNGNRNSPSDQPAVFPLLSRSHGAPDNATAITVGDFYNENTLIFGDVLNGNIYAATLNASRQVTNVQVFDTGVPYIVDMEKGPDGWLYAADLGSGTIRRWVDPAATGSFFAPT